MPALELLAFDEHAERYAAILNGVALGDSGDGRKRRAMEDVLAVIEQSMETGSVVARQARESISKRVQSLRADVIAEYFSREHNAASLFAVARELDHEAHSRSEVKVGDLSTAAKSALGILADFTGTPRQYLLGTLAKDPASTTSGAEQSSDRLL